MIQRIFFLALIAMITPLPALAETVEIPPECRVLPEHRAAADVAYRPGMDVRGKPVVPADVNASPLGTDQTIVVPLTIDLAERLQGMNVPGLNMETTLGFLEFSPDGRVTYNGQDLTSQVHVLCGESISPAAPVVDGQTPSDGLKSPPVNTVNKTPPKPVTPPVPAVNGNAPAGQQ